ncbi:MAG: serine/threonine-protein kinase, partial [Planctomycetota bacterium]
MSDPRDDQDPVDAIAEEFASRLRNGEQPDIGEYRARYPEHAEAIDDLFPTLELMESLKPNAVPTTSSGGPVSGGLAVEQFGEYRIVREIGRGGMGIVYEALQESLDRRVALKVLPSSVLYSPNKLERFHREARAVAQLHHTNIVPVYGVGEEDGTHYFVMQHIEGRSVDAIIRELREADRLSADSELEELPGLSYPQAVARIGHQVADALGHAHGHGTLHRDIKPANLILDREGNVWVADFGLAKMEESEDLTHSGSVLGTLRYSAPEQIEGHSSTSSDLYALGMTLYELLNLGPAFPETEQRRLLQRILHDDPPTLRDKHPELPVDLETVVLKCLAKDPAHRYPTAEALADDLERVRIGVPIHARRVSAAERLVRWCRRNRAVAGALAVALLGLIVGAASGWTAYVETRAALQRESENVELSVSALREIFDSLAPGEAPTPDLSTEPRRDRPPPRREASRAVAENKEVQVLTSILDFYDRFSAKNETDVELRREAARAYRRVCDLHIRRENSELAWAAGERSRAILAQLSQEHPNDAAIQLDIAETACELAQCALKAEAENTAQGLSTAVEVTRRVEADAGTEEQRERAIAIRARALGLRGLARLETDEAPAAISDLETACDYYGGLARPHPAARKSHATYTVALARAYTRSDRAEEAVTLIEDEFLGPGGRPSRVRDPETMGEVHQALSEAFRELGDLQRAARHERLARRPRDERDGRPPPRRGPGGRPRGPGT